MKKLGLFLCSIALLLHSCKNDDDVMLPQCAVPNALSESDITFNSATLNWNDANSANLFSIEYGLSGFTPGTGTVLPSSSTSVIINNLSASTTYDYYVQAVCAENNRSLQSEVKSFTTLANPVVPAFLENLSELNLYSGNLADLNPSPYAFKYELNTALFTDYAHKERLIALPNGASMTYDGDGLPIFPDNTVIAKTFYYNLDERDLSLGRKIIETRILIKLSGDWVAGDYKWNEDQTEAVLEEAGSDVPVSWIDAEGETNTITYRIPSNTDCYTCHSTSDIATPIGPKLRMLNFETASNNQLQSFIDAGYIDGISSVNDIATVPNWLDTNYSLEERARAYLDINCAHCHIDGGFCDDQSILRLDYATLFEDSKILERKNSIDFRIGTYQQGVSMPFIGTTILHDEGVALLQQYLDSLE